jgi:hypothetical protein
LVKKTGLLLLLETLKSSIERFMVVVLSAAVGFKSRDRGFDWSKSKWFSIDPDERYFSSRNYSLSLSLYQY